MSAVALDSNRVFIVYTPEASFKMYGTICTIEGTNITKGEDVQLINNTYQTGDKIAVKINENKVFIAYENIGDGNKLYSLVCIINGNSITVGTDTLLSTIQYSGYNFSIVALSENKVLIAHSNQSRNILYGLVCTINENIITIGKLTSLSSLTNAGLRISIAVLSETKIFIAHSRYSEKLLYGIICTISGTTITKEKDKALKSTENAGNFLEAGTLSENKVLVVYSLADSYLYGMICAIDTDITIEIDMQLSLVPNLSYIQSVLLLSNNKVFVTYITKINYSSRDTCLFGMICSANEDTITVEINTSLSTEQYSGNSVSATKLTENEIFIAHERDDNECLYAMICMDKIYSEIDLLDFSTNNIYGVAKTNAQEGQQVDIYRPYEEVAV